MKFYDAGFTILIVALIVSLISAGASYKFLGQSSPITQEIEAITEKEGESLLMKETGIDITPVLNPPIPVPQASNAIQK